MPTQRNAGVDGTNWEEFITHDGLFVVDSQQRIVYWSPSAERLLGHSADEVTGKPCYEVVGGRDARNFRFCRRECPVVLNARHGRPTPDYDIHCISPGGESKWLNVSVVIPRERRTDPRVLHLCRDVSRRRQIEEFARKASSALREVLAGEGGDHPVAAEPSPAPLPRLSRREVEVLRLLASGMKTEEIAETLVLEPVTVRNHITRLMTRLGVRSRLQAVVYASQHGLI